MAGAPMLDMDARVTRVRRLVDDARRLLTRAIDEQITEHRDGRGRSRAHAATVILFSGGNDSTVLAHLMRGQASHAAHANTGIGVERTREFVRDVSAGWGLPLLERFAPAGSTYDELLTERRDGGEIEGFPGPARHWKMYQRLKLRAVEQVQRELIGNPLRERVVLLAGRRLDESARRSQRNIPEIDRRKSAVWVSPLRDWTALDMNTYRMLHPDCPRNDVSDMLHMSGECLCGAFAAKDELEQIGAWFPRVVDHIRRLERRVRDAGAPDERCRWGWGAYRDRRRQERPSKVGPMCSNCAVRREG
jgi:3'-phosphoadenosine 5'-phosphosulfate sulfotransferase (PAPS reductase)/FAD synthetase